MSEDYKIAFIDIETSPNLGYIWGKYEQNVIAFEREWHLMSFSVKWQGQRTPITYGLCDFPGYNRHPEDDKRLAKKLWDVLNEADLVIAHNGDRFDIRKSNARFVFHGFAPPTPYKTVDTLKIARKYFNFNSNKLDDLAKYLGLGEKVDTGGFDLWLGCMRGDASAWAKMKKYNAHDVVLLEKVYERFRGWHVTHPNINLNSNPRTQKCPACASKNLIRRGWSNAQVMRAQRYQCNNCGKYSTGAKEKIPGRLLR